VNSPLKEHVMQTCREVTEGVLFLLNRGLLKKQMNSLLCNSFFVFLLSF